jgi:hypothetical protein
MDKGSRSPKLRVSFLIDTNLVGDFIHAYADKVQIQEIVAVQSVQYNKNFSPASNRIEARAIAEKARADVIELLSKEAPLSRKQILDKLTKYPRPWLQQLLYRLAMEKVVVKTKKGQGGELVLPGQPERTEGGQRKKASQPQKAIAGTSNTTPKVKKPRPPGGFNFERPEIRAKATAAALKKQRAAGHKAVNTAKKKGIDFAELGRKGNEAKKLKRQQQLNGNGGHPQSAAPAPSPSVPPAGE